MIRLGSLAGYPFEGPRVLAGWTPPPVAAVYAVMYRPDPDIRPDHYAVIYVGHADDLSAVGLPFRHPRAPCWLKRAPDRWKLHVAIYQVPGGSATHRARIVEELCASYHPQCNEQQFERAWKDEWIGDYSAPTAGPLTTGREPDQPGS